MLICREYILFKYSILRPISFNLIVTAIIATVFCLSILSNVIYSCDVKAVFSASLLQSSESNDPSEIILMLIYCSRNISYHYQC